MPDKIFYELDSLFETMGLLFVGTHFDEVKQEMIKALAAFGIDGEQFYRQHLKIFDQYVRSFQKNKVEDPLADLFFGEEDLNYYLILLFLLNENRGWLDSADDLDDGPVLKQLLNTCKVAFDERESATPQTMTDIIAFLDKSELAVGAKWKMLRIMERPAESIKNLIRIVNTNAGAYQKAFSEIEKSLPKLMKQYDGFVAKQEDKTFYALRKGLSQTTKIYPSLALPLSQLIYEGVCFYGLISGVVAGQGQSGRYAKEALLSKLKALSDGSKLEILVSLKVSPKYNLEIAQQLGLTAATMSHHMGTLLGCGFVGIEKKEGKVYYHLNEENIKAMIAELEETLL